MTNSDNGTHDFGKADRVALVTGGARGLGLETSRQLARLGAHVLIGARTPGAAEEAATRLREEDRELRATGIKLDVTSADDRQAARDRIAAEFGRLDILVNNAGILLDAEDAAHPPRHPPSATDPAIVRETYETNVFAPLALIQIMLPLVRRSAAPRIVNLSSSRGSLAYMADPALPAGPGRMLAYDSSKAALNAITLMLADELRDTPIKINAIHPGWVRTGMGGAEAHLGIEEGARTAVRFATLPDDGPTGGFFHHDQRLPW